MDNKKTITIIILGLVAMAGILLFLFLPSKSHLANIDFYVYDTTTVQRNYPIGSVDLNRNHSSDVLV